MVEVLARDRVVLGMIVRNPHMNKVVFYSAMAQFSEYFFVAVIIIYLRQLTASME